MAADRQNTFNTAKVHQFVQIHSLIEIKKAMDRLARKAECYIEGNTPRGVGVGNSLPIC
jgi:hypothetical protein